MDPETRSTLIALTKAVEDLTLVVREGLAEQRRLRQRIESLEARNKRDDHENGYGEGD